jgi:hypothetical protein
MATKKHKPRKRAPRPVSVTGTYRKELNTEQMSQVIGMLGRQRLKEKRAAGIDTTISDERLAELEKRHPDLVR